MSFKKIVVSFFYKMKSLSNDPGLNVKIKKLYSEPKFYNHIAKTIHALHQSHCIVVTQGDIFMEQKRRFGLVLGRRLAILKKIGTDYEELLRVGFSCFQGQKNNLKSF